LSYVEKGAMTSVVCYPSVTRSVFPFFCAYTPVASDIVLSTGGGRVIDFNPSLLGLGVQSVTAVIEFNTSVEFCSSTVNVTDSTPPSLLCVKTEFLLDSLCTSADFLAFKIPASDACDASITSGSLLAGTTITGPGTKPYIYTATDATGNVGTQPCSVKLTDNIAPTLNCTKQVTPLPVGDSCVMSIPDSYKPTASDNCDQVVTPSELAPVPLGGRDYEVQYAVTDTSGNSVQGCPIRLVDTTAASLTCPFDLSVVADEITCRATLPSIYKASVHTPCGSDLGFVLPTTTSYGVGSHATTFSYDDLGGKKFSCTKTVTVTDATPPKLQCPASITIPSDNNCVAQVPAEFTPTGVDSCGPVTVTRDSSAVLSGDGDHWIRFSGRDPNGNKDSTTCPLSVTDKSTAIITCPTSPLILVAGTGCTASLPSNYTATATTQCGNSLSPIKATQTTGYSVGTHTVYFSTVDPSGKTINCNSSVQVVDNDTDGACGTDDKCPNTTIATEVKTTYLKKGSYIASGTPSPSTGFAFRSTTTAATQFTYTTKDTGGCTCAQMVAQCGYHRIYLKYGCPKDMMDAWTGKYSQAGKGKFVCLRKYMPKGSKNG
jgi:hypothetical protein